MKNITDVINLNTDARNPKLISDISHPQKIKI
jgi:hypothetical protein